MKVAIVCDWLTGTGGAERVVLELHKLYPEAPIYTSQYNSDPKIWHGDNWFSDADIRTGWLQRLPTGLKKFLPVVRAWYFSRLDLSDYDLVISSSGAEAKFVRTKPKNKKSVRRMQLAAAQGASEDRKGDVQDSTLTADQNLQHSDAAKSASGAAGSAGRQAGAVHVSYCHAPTHYYWSRYDDYLENPGFGKLDWLARIGLKILLGPMRRWDYKAAQRPHYMVANSNYIQDQIKKYYGRDSVVIHPPVDVERFAGTADEPRRGFVVAGRQTPYKKIDLAVIACTELELPLLVLGGGSDHNKLKKMAGKSVTFLRGKSDEELAHYFQTSLAFIFPGVDDFGIVAVEALAAGTPVIAFKAGGALDYVQPGKTGEFFSEQTADSLVSALRKFNPENYNNSQIQKSAAKFSPDSFRATFKKFVEKVI